MKWETHLGAPAAWKMTPAPSLATAETIPGNPAHLNPAAAENELALLASRGAGQPYLIAVKLRDEPDTLHLRVHLGNPSPAFEWADLALVPPVIQDLAAETSRNDALEWSLIQSGGELPDVGVTAALAHLNTPTSPAAVLDALDPDSARALASYLRNPGYGLFFDPTQNHTAWVQPAPIPAGVAPSVGSLLEALDARLPATLPGDAAAEESEADAGEVEVFRRRIGRKSFEVLDSTATVKTRGSAQRAFADAVKGNYGHRCAVTGVATREFLVAAHIVPWSVDPRIRLDPSNGICLSVLADRAFESGYLQIDDDLTVRIDWGRVGGDAALQSQLQPYDGRKLHLPVEGQPKVEYLRRRRALVAPPDVTSNPS